MFNPLVHKSFEILEDGDDQIYLDVQIGELAAEYELVVEVDGYYQEFRYVKFSEEKLLELRDFINDVLELK